MIKCAAGFSSYFLKKSVLLSLPAVLISTQTNKEVNHRIFLKPLEITLERGSPPYSAFEDSQIFNLQSSIKKSEVETHLEPLTIDGRFDQNIYMVSKGSTVDVQNEEFYSNRRLTGLTIVLAETPKEIKDPRLIAAEEYLRQTSVPTTWQVKAQELIEAAKEEIKADKLNAAKVRTIKSVNGSVIIVGKPTKDMKKTTGNEISRSKRTVFVTERKPAPKNNQEQIVSAALQPTAELPPAAASGHTLAGNIKLKGGAAILPGMDALRIFHVREQSARSEAVINLQQAAYKIDVDMPQGLLVAELRNKEGLLIAKGEKNLLSLPLSGVKNGRLENIDLEIKPVTNNLKLKTIKFESKTLSKPSEFQGANLEVTDIKRQVAFDKRQEAFIDTDIVTPSSLFVKATGKGLWPTLQHVVLGEMDSVVVPQKSTIMNWLEALQPRREAMDLADQSAAWGVIRKNGKPIENAVVSLIKQNDLKANYFSGVILDQNRITTSANGEFAIFGMKLDTDMLLVQRLGEDYPPIIIQTKPGLITYLDVDFTDIDINIKTYDINSQEGVESVVGFIEHPVNYKVSEAGDSYKADLGLHHSVLMVDAGVGYAVGSVCVNSQMKEVVVPLIKQDKLDALVDAAPGVPLDLKRYVSYGVIEGDNYSVTIGSALEYTKIIYLNPDGSIRKEKFGVDGGAFVIVGVSPGYHSLVVVPEKSKKVIMRPIWVSQDQPGITFLNLNI
jgi:hypothetical protein